MPSRVSICAGAPCYRRVEIMRFQVARESPGGIVRLASTFVKYVWTVKITQKRRQLGVPFIIFPRAALEPAHSSGCGRLQ